MYKLVRSERLSSIRIGTSITIDIICHEVYDINNIFLFSYCQRGVSMKTNKLLALMVSVLMLCSCSSNAPDTNKVKEAAEEAGLLDVSISYNGTTEYGFQRYTITSSNFGDLSTDEMYTVDDKILEIAGPVWIDSYNVDSDKYVVWSETKTITKNGETIDDDYQNSSAYHKENPDVTDENFDNLNKFKLIEDESKMTDCWLIAEESIKAQLKSPDTAEFPFSSNSDGVTIWESISSDPKCYIVTAWVNAENSFGEFSKSNFVVLLYEDGYGKLYIYSSAIDG